MGEMAEAPAPVDQSPPSDVSGGAGESQAAAADSYNARAVTGSEGRGASQADSTPTPGSSVDENGQAADSSAPSSESSDTDGDQGSSADQGESDPAGQADGSPAGQQKPADFEAGEVAQPSAESQSEPTRVDDQSAESEPPKTEPAPSPEREAPTQQASEEEANSSGNGKNRAQQEGQQKGETPSNGDGPEPHKLKYDPEKEKELARRQMMNPHYFLPTDFSQYFDIRSGEGPKQSEEPLSSRANRRLDELKAWSKKMQEQSPLVYNRKVGKTGA